MARLRIIQRGDLEYVVQQRRWFFWRDRVFRGTEQDARLAVMVMSENMRIRALSPVIAEFDETGREVRDLC